MHAARTRFHDPGMGHLGFGLPYALALQMQHPGRPVFNITGDGAFGFTLQELDTARRYGLPVVNVIHNNAAWGIIRAGPEGAARTSSWAPAAGHGLRGDRARLRLLRRDGDSSRATSRPAIARALASACPR